ncbi:MAG: capsid protein [Wigfec virus K19_571]|nr:MAG: capsid protein [Wigfec virus K19_571]
MPYSKKRKYSRRRTYKSRKTYKRPKLSKNFRKAVKTIMTRACETKAIQFPSQVQNCNNNITNTSVFNIIPAISQGTSQSTRIGNKISPVYFTLRLSLTCLNIINIYALASPTYFDIYIFKWKSTNEAGGAPTAGDMNRFLQDNATGQSYNGELMDGLRPLNADQFTLLVKKRCTLSNFNAVNSTSGIFQQTNPNKTFYFNLTKHLKKVWIYDDNGTQVENDNFYIAVASTQTDGQSTGTSVTGNWQYISDLRFKDA